MFCNTRMPVTDRCVHNTYCFSRKCCVLISSDVVATTKKSREQRDVVFNPSITVNPEINRSHYSETLIIKESLLDEHSVHTRN